MAATFQIIIIVKFRVPICSRLKMYFEILNTDSKNHTTKIYTYI